MNQFGPSPSSHESSPSIGGQQPMNEIPSFPIAQETYVPAQPVEQQRVAPVEQQVAPIEQPVAMSAEQYTPVETPAPQNVESYAPAQVEQQTYSVPEAQNVPVSEVPNLQTQLEYKTTREGERVFNNPNLGQTTFKGGVTTQQLVSKVAGYYTVNQGLINDPHSGLLQQTAQTGSPTQATTWQAVMLFKILQAFWKSLGLS